MSTGIAKRVERAATHRRQTRTVAKKAVNRSPRSRSSDEPKSSSQTAKTPPRSTRSRRQQKQRQQSQRGASLDAAIDEPLDDGFRFTVAHAFILLSYLFGTALFIVFGLDLLVEIPFDRGSISYDIANLVGGLTLIYLSWNCQRDLK